ncbi:MAG: hypothetical protein NTZ09_13990 [Candidatus Hydrogenedentes bacterium]|nr:hypothetical protein [Candidatus Hydrogenedentota bacterium]
MTGAGQFLVYVVAFLLPWWHYIDLPQYLVFPLFMSELALVVLFVVDSVRRGLRVPFEYLLPLGLLVALNAVGYVAYFWMTPVEFRQPLDHVYCLYNNLWPIAVLAAVHFMSRREAALAALDVLAVSVGMWSAVALLGRFTGVFVTAGMMGLEGCWGLPNLVVYGIVAAMLGAGRRDRGSAGRWVLDGAGVMSLAAFLILGLPVLDVRQASFEWIGWWLPVQYLASWVVFKLLAFWPVARMAAKVEVVRRESQEKRDAVYLLVLMGLAALALVRYLLTIGTEYFVVALAGAWALPERAPGWYRPDWRLGAVAGALCVLIGFNLVNVNPHNFRDPRNYAPDPVFQKAGTMGDYDVSRLERVEARYPMETQTNFWLAYDRLSRGELFEAAMEYRESLWTDVTRTGQRVKTILPPPTDEQRRAFMDKLRDQSSAVAPGEHQGAYVVALLGEDRVDEALAMMRKDAGTASVVPAVDESGRDVLAWGVSVYVYDLELYERLSDWTAGDLLGLLVAWGAQIEQAPEGVADDCLPVVVVSRAGMCEASPPELVSGDGVKAVCLAGDGRLAIGRGQVEACAEGVAKTVECGAPEVVVRVKPGDGEQGKGFQGA